MPAFDATSVEAEDEKLCCLLVGVGCGGDEGSGFLPSTGGRKVGLFEVPCGGGACSGRRTCCCSCGKQVRPSVIISPGCPTVAHGDFLAAFFPLLRFRPLPFSVGAATAVEGTAPPFFFPLPCPCFFFPFVVVAVAVPPAPCWRLAAADVWLGVPRTKTKCGAIRVGVALYAHSHNRDQT